MQFRTISEFIGKIGRFLIHLNLIMAALLSRSKTILILARNISRQYCTLLTQKYNDLQFLIIFVVFILYTIPHVTPYS